MGMLTDVVFAPAAGPLKGVLWLARIIAEQAELTLYDEGVIRAALLDLEQQLEAGEIDEDAYETQETVLLERLKIARERKRSGL